MKLGILNADQVKPEFAKEFGEYPDMFAEIFRAVDILQFSDSLGDREFLRKVKKSHFFR